MPDLVWSSDGGDLRKAKSSQPSRQPAAGGVKVRREVAGRRGKAVTTVSGVPVDDAGLRELAGKLEEALRRRRLGQERRDRAAGRPPRDVMQVLRDAGYDPVLAGG